MIQMLQRTMRTHIPRVKLRLRTNCALRIVAFMQVMMGVRGGRERKGRGNRGKEKGKGKGKGREDDGERWEERGTGK